jgi:hypothetical protein
MFIRKHMYHTKYMRCTVLQVFSWVFTEFLLQIHVFLKHFTYSQEYTCIILYTWNALFCKCFHVFALGFHCRNMDFCYIQHVYKITHLPFFSYKIHCFASVFLCFYCVFTAEPCTFGTSHMFSRKHMYHSVVNFAFIKPFLYIKILFLHFLVTLIVVFFSFSQLSQYRNRNLLASLISCQWTKPTTMRPCVYLNRLWA